MTDEIFANPNVELVWGIQSKTDNSGEPRCSLISVNDIELDYWSDNKYYTLDVSTYYDVDGKTEEERNKIGLQYLMGLLDAFETFCKNTNVDTTYVPDYAGALSFSIGGHQDETFKSIEEAFAFFKISVLGYKALVEMKGGKDHE